MALRDREPRAELDASSPVPCTAKISLLRTYTTQARPAPTAPRMQEPGRRTTPPFAGVDLRRPKGYPASTPAKEEAPVPAEAAAAGDPCPRCESRDTKFCYYNNYNTSQPRHFCKSCRRYWTKGGCLRNVPVGGGSRKSSSSSATPKNPKRSKNSKRRRIAPAPEPTPSTDANTATAAGADAAPTGAAAKGNADDPATPLSVDEVFTGPSVALGLGLTDASGKELPDPSPFEWPSGCDLGSYRANGVFADTDPALFLNLP